MIAWGHPVMIEYVLARMRTDVAASVEKKNNHAVFYIEPVLRYIRSLDLETTEMTPHHDRAALAVELLCDLGAPQAVAALREILAGRSNSALRRLVAGALYRSKNRAAVELARPLLDSPFGELKTYAALLLGREGVEAAIDPLLDIQRTEKRRGVDVLTLANWYLIQMSGQAAASVANIAKSVK
jgi:HEAT repeat protein